MNILPHNFVAFILTHGRPGNIKTYKALRDAGYTGQIRLIVDDEDPTLPLYREQYPEEVLTFSKAAIAAQFDRADNFKDWRTIFFARNAAFDLARITGFRYFIELDDDYRDFAFRRRGRVFKVKSLDRIFTALVKFLNSSDRITCVAMSQGGDLDHIWLRLQPGQYATLRKVMNSFVCDTAKQFPFLGRLNEDVNTYVALGAIGFLFFTIYNVQLTQTLTQTNPGGMTDTYIDSGTYIKSFYPVMYAPSCVKIGNMGFNQHRIHHVIDWNSAVPKIMRQLDVESQATT